MISVVIYLFVLLTAQQTDGSREVNSAFPEPLKEPVLRKVQFSTISRIDSLGTSYFAVFFYQMGAEANLKCSQ